MLTGIVPNPLHIEKRDSNVLTEVADNTYRDGSSELNNTEDSFVKDGGVSVDQRKMNAVRAYFEWMPIRLDICLTSYPLDLHTLRGDTS